jgi:hypothetical protein
MCLVWLNRSGVDATFYDAVEFDPMLTVTIGRNRPKADVHEWPLPPRCDRLRGSMIAMLPASQNEAAEIALAATR